MIKQFDTCNDKLDVIFDLEDGFCDTMWINNCIELLDKAPIQRI